MRKEDCLFCKIVAGEIPSAKVYEDDRVLAFEDVNPQMRVHTLIVPKNHYDNIGDGIPDDEMGYLFNTVKKIAELKGIAESGYRVIVNTNDDAQQSVHHIHVHVLGGAPMNSGDPSAKYYSDLRIRFDRGRLAVVRQTASTLVFGERRAAGRYRPPFARGAFRRHLRIYALGIPKEAGR